MARVCCELASMMSDLAAADWNFTKNENRNPVLRSIMRDGDGVGLQMPAPRAGTLASLVQLNRLQAAPALYSDSPPFPHAPERALPAALWRLRR